jgi:hypothetical protein
MVMFAIVAAIIYLVASFLAPYQGLSKLLT